MKPSWQNLVSILSVSLLSVNPVVISGSPIVRYDFDGNSLTPDILVPNVSASNINLTGSGISSTGFINTPYPGGIAPVFSVTPGSPISSDPATAITNNKFFQFTVTPNAGFLANLYSLSFQAARTGDTTRGWVVTSSVGGLTVPIATADIMTNRTTLSPFTVDLASAAFQGLTMPVTFRIYTYTPSAVAAVDYDNIILDGSIVPVPEPGLLGLLAAAAGTGLALRSRRSRTCL